MALVGVACAEKQPLHRVSRVFDAGFATPRRKNLFQRRRVLAGLPTAGSTDSVYCYDEGHGLTICETRMVDDAALAATVEHVRHRDMVSALVYIAAKKLLELLVFLLLRI